MPSTSTTGPVRDVESGWSELAFDLTAVALGLAWLVGTGYVALLGFGLRRKRFGILFTVLLLLGSGFAGLVGLDAYRSRPADPVEQGPRTCQESSGGDNRCPGG